MSKSIIQPGKTRECYLCREEADRIGYFGDLPQAGLHKHHFMHGTANRKKAEHFGLWAYMCVKRHHEYGQEAPHANAQVDLRLKQIAQTEFEKKYSHEIWMKEFGKSYLNETGQQETEKGRIRKDAGEGFKFIVDQLGG